MTRILLRFAAVPLVATLAISCAPSNQARTPPVARERAVAAAVVEFFPARHSDVHGLLHVRIIDNGVLFRGNVFGLKAGLYGFGVHENGDCSAFDGKSAGGLIAANGSGSAKPLGRLDDLVVEHDGGANFQRVEERLTLSGSNSIVGKSLVVEAWPYDPKTDPTSVPFVACGVVRAD
jgi:Cu-Zn family superoxide dismutase